MRRDLRQTERFQQIEAVFQSAYAVGSGRPYDLLEPALSPDGRTVAASGPVIDRLEGLPDQRIVLVDAATGALRLATAGPNRDRLPRWDPAAKRIAYLSDAASPYDFQLAVLTLESGTIDRFPLAGRWIENLHWRADGGALLLQAAGQGADLAGAQGAFATPVAAQDAPGWAPEIEGGAKDPPWRTLWLCDPANGDLRQVSPPGVNIWEAAWCGLDRIVCIASDDPSEEAWYRADVRLIDLSTGTVSTLYTPRHQLGWLSANSQGSIAFVEAVCSDRILVAGDVLLGDANGVRVIDTLSTDVTFTQWQGETLLFAGLRGFDTIIGRHEPRDGTSTLLWRCDRRTVGGALYPEVSAAPDGSVAFMAEGHLSPPTLTILSPDGVATEVLKIEAVPTATSHPGATVEHAEWQAPDGQTVQGWLLRPSGDGPFPLVMDVHGGPVWRTRPRFVGRGGYAGALLRDGYAVFQPNPRGSSGQGQAFAAQVLGDVGGADARDLLAGIDHLVASGTARHDRIGVVGGSYGGFMAAWLVTQDPRFAAAVAIAPVANWVSLRLTTHVPSSIDMMLGGPLAGNEERYLALSPIAHAHRAKTPTLIVTGALDRSTPPGQGVELHHALQGAGAPSMLLTYPGEGHGVRQFPAILDYITRIVDWFGTHMPPETRSAPTPPEA